MVTTIEKLKTAVEEAARAWELTLLLCRCAVPGSETMRLAQRLDDEAVVVFVRARRALRAERRAHRRVAIHAFSALVAITGAILMLSACGGSGTGTEDCDDAYHRLVSCGAETQKPHYGDCSGSQRCTADCINDASCEAINSTDIAGSNAMVACVEECVK